MSDQPTIGDLHADIERAQARLREAQEAERLRPAMPTEEVKSTFEKAWAIISDEKSSPKVRHDTAQAALLTLEAGKHQGREIDLLAQAVVDNREE